MAIHIQMLKPMGLHVAPFLLAYNQWTIKVSNVYFPPRSSTLFDRQNWEYLFEDLGRQNDARNHQHVSLAGDFNVDLNK